MILSLLSCTVNTCPDADDRFVPTEDPAHVFRAADGNYCDGELMEEDRRLSEYSVVHCDCASWCDDRYLGGLYCVSNGTVEAWAARSCPSCGYHYGANPHPTAIYVSCTGCEK